MANVIEIKDLHFSYEEKEVLKGLSFCVESGSYVAIVGTNGSGKSTLAKIISGLLFAKSGEVKVFDNLIDAKSITIVRKKIGIIFQNPDNQFVGVTVKDDIAFGLENSRVERSEMIRLIDEFATLTNVSHLLDKTPDNLSGGEKQRVGIAGVLALAPELVILDEATAMLDPKGVREVNDCIAKLEGKTILNITHNLSEILVADKVLVLKKGEILAYDTPMNVLLGSKILESGLELPDEIKVLKEVKQLNNKELEEALCKLIFKK